MAADVIIAENGSLTLKHIDVITQVFVFYVWRRDGAAVPREDCQGQKKRASRSQGCTEDLVVNPVQIC